MSMSKALAPGLDDVVEGHDGPGDLGRRRSRAPRRGRRRTPLEAAAGRRVAQLPTEPVGDVGEVEVRRDRPGCRCRSSASPASSARGSPSRRRSAVGSGVDASLGATLGASVGAVLADGLAAPAEQAAAKAATRASAAMARVVRMGVSSDGRTRESVPRKRLPVRWEMHGVTGRSRRVPGRNVPKRCREEVRHRFDG